MFCFLHFCLRKVLRECFYRTTMQLRAVIIYVDIIISVPSSYQPPRGSVTADPFCFTVFIKPCVSGFDPPVLQFCDTLSNVVCGVMIQPLAVSFSSELLSCLAVIVSCYPLHSPLLFELSVLFWGCAFGSCPCLVSQSGHGSRLTYPVTGNVEYSLGSVGILLVCLCVWDGVCNIWPVFPPQTVESISRQLKMCPCHWSQNEI